MLTKLSLRGNQLQKVDDNVFTEQLGGTLQILDLAHNNLQNLSVTTFQYLSKLTWLNLQSNGKINLEAEKNGINVTIFPEALSNLKTLDLSYCNINVIGNNTFINLRHLETLILSYNPLLAVPKTIRSSFYLQKLDLQETSINGLQDCDFCGLQNLKILNLESIKSLSFIHENAFGSLSNPRSTVPNITEFSIKSCNVSILPEKLLNWKNVSKICINGNPFICGCDMAWIINDISAKNPTYANNLIDRLWHGKRDSGFSLSCYESSKMIKLPFKLFNGTLCTGQNFNASAFYDSSKFYVNDDVSDDIATCNLYVNELECHIFCTRENQCKPTLNHTNIQIFKKNFTLRSVSIENANITVLQKGKILPDYVSTIESINIEYSKLKRIETESFDEFTNLESLNLDGNVLRKIDTGIFTKNIGETLLKLSLAKNYLKMLSFKAFENLTMLNSLNLNTNPNIISTSENFFSISLLNLTTLELKECNISSLGKDIFSNLTNIDMLDLSHNPLNSIPTSIKRLDNLRTLVFESTSLKGIEKCDFCELTNLDNLQLDRNYDLSYIHENAFGVITNENDNIFLNYFSISKCNISFLSPKLMNWKKVRHHNFEENPWKCNCSMMWLINDMMDPYDRNQYRFHEKENLLLKCHSPPNLAGLSMQQYVTNYCINCTTGKIENAVFETNTIDKNIYYICGDDEVNKNSKCTCEYGLTVHCTDLNHTNIRVLKSAYEGHRLIFNKCNFKILNFDNMLPEMQNSAYQIFITFSNVQKIKEKAFDKFLELSTLKLANNLLTEIDENVLTNKLNLATLDLSYNQFRTLKKSAFKNLNGLNNLNLRHNPELNISSLFFPTSLRCLKHLDLSGCNIITLDKNIFSNLKNLRSLDLSFNPITSIPKAINLLSHLWQLSVSGTHITTLTNNGLKLNSNLTIFIAEFSNLERIEDCAFCSFPNLDVVSFYYSKKLSFIHENAFGSITSNGTTYPKYVEDHQFEEEWENIQQKYFVGSHCNLSVIPEKLLNWSEIDFFNQTPSSIAIHNLFKCDCENEWLIKKFKNAENYFGAGYQCFSPPEFRGMSFFDLPDSFCAKT